MKKMILLVLAVFCISSASCGQAEETTYPQLQLPDTKDLVFSVGETVVPLENDTYGVHFTAEEMIYMLNVRFVSEKNASALMELYKWDTDYETTVKHEPIKKSSFRNIPKKEDNSLSAATFLTEQMPQSGEYLAVFSSKSGADIMIGEKTDDAVKNGIVCYKNGLEIQQAPNVTVVYYLGY